MQILSTPAVLALLLIGSGCAGPSSAPPSPSTTQPVSIRSGLQKGEDIIPWNPIHVAGPNAGTNACPVCTYGPRPAVIVFMKNSPALREVTDQLQTIVRQNKSRDLHGFVVVTDADYAEMKDRAKYLNVTDIALCYLNPSSREKDLSDYKINPTADNTVIIYKDFTVDANLVNLPAHDFIRVQSAVDKLK